jgi:diguanylate cyclase (GGDEF)-like protein
MVDIDHFKNINDTYGHLAGDEVLCEVARRMRSSLRPYDTIGRFGGEEFLLVLPGCSLDAGVKLAERLCRLVCSVPAKARDKSVDVSISLGVAFASQPVLGDLEALLASADAALYRAKEAGRNRVEVSLDLRGPSLSTSD